MTEHRIRTGDVVAVTARVVGVRGDGSYSIEPLGFDYDFPDPEQLPHNSDDEPLPPEVEFYTVDEPKLVQHVWTRGDELFDPIGERFVYDKPLGNGLHLLNRPDVPQHLEGAWRVVETAWVGGLKPDPSEISGS